MPDLLIYHPGTGTVIPLRDEVYLVNTAFVDGSVLDAMEDGLTTTEREHKGYRLDNTNMGRLFYGGTA